EGQASERQCTKKEFLKDFPCGDGQHFIEYKKVKKCLRFEAVPATWHAARAQCQAHGGDLLTIPTQELNKMIVNDETIQGDVWLGLERKSGEKDVWVSGETYRQVNALPLVGAIELCVVFQMDGSWRSSQCDSNYAYYCEIQHGDRLYPPSVTFNGSSTGSLNVQGGTNLTATCRGFVGDWGVVFFVISWRWKVRFFHFVNKEVENLEERAYIMNGQRCDRRTVSRLTLLGSSLWNNWAIRCCVSRVDHEPQCTGQTVVNVK
ncbi:hypothetical protein EGW08_019103, partial [Elysia chlorotica]